MLPLSALARNADGPPMALFHGFLESPAIWGACDAGLWSDHDTYAMPLPGHGPWPETAPELETLLNADAFIDAYAERLERARPGKQWRLVGHSTGALVALALARRAPELVADICTIAPMFTGAACGRNLQGAIVRLPVVGALTFRWLIERWLGDHRTFMTGVQTVADGMLDPSVDLSRMRQELAASQPNLLYRFGHWIGEQDMAGSLSDVDRPIHAMICSEDRVVDPQHQLALIKSTPRASAVLLKSGHLPMFERPRDFTNAFTAWRNQGADMSAFSDLAGAVAPIRFRAAGASFAGAPS